MRVRSILFALSAGFAGASAWAAPTGDAIRNAGGPESSANAMDAIQGTCADLINPSAPPLTTQQVDLRTRCGEMVQTVNDFYDIPNAGTALSYGYANESDVLGTIRQFSGEEQSSQTRLATDGTNRQFATVGARMDAIRTGARASSGIAVNGLAMPALGGAASADDADTGWGWFVNANVGMGDRDGTSNENEFDFDSYGATLGFDYVLDSGLALGFAIGFSDFDLDFDDGSSSAQVNEVAGGGIETDGYTLSGFATYAFDDMYTSAIIGFGANDYDLNRKTIFVPTTGSPVNREFKADTESDQVAGQATLGRVFGDGATTFDLYGALDYLTVDVDGYTETDTSGGGLALQFGDQSVDSFQSILGGTVRHNISTSAGIVVPHIGVEWHHEFEDSQGSLAYRYANAIGDANGDGIAAPSFQTPTDDIDEDYFELSLGVSAQFRNNVFAFVQYDTTLGLEDLTTHLFTIGLRGVF